MADTVLKQHQSVRMALELKEHRLAAFAGDLQALEWSQKQARRLLEHEQWLQAAWMPL